MLNANQQKSVLEESLHNTKTEEQRLRTKLAEAEEVRFAFFCFVCFYFKDFYWFNVSPAQVKDNTAHNEVSKSSFVESNKKMNLVLCY